MSLLPKLQQIHDPMPMSLGKAIAKAIAPKVDPIAAFNKGGGFVLDDTGLQRLYISEVDCRQIKGAAKLKSIKDLEQAAFERWLARVCPSGDVESVQSQWLASSDYEEFCEEQRPVEPPSVQKFKVGDSVGPAWRKRRPGETWVVTAVIENFEHFGERCTRVEWGPTDWARAESLELIEPAPTPDAEAGDGWVTWNGGKCPVTAYTRVDTRSRCHEAEPRTNQLAGEIPADRWAHDGIEKAGSEYEIVAYRLVSK